jgi:predicted methyltransferase
MKPSRIYSIHYLNGKYSHFEDHELIANTRNPVMSRDEAKSVLAHFRNTQHNRQMHEMEAGEGAFTAVLIPNSRTDIKIYGYAPSDFTIQDVLANLDRVVKMDGPWYKL